MAKQFEIIVASSVSFSVVCEAMEFTNHDEFTQKEVDGWAGKNGMPFILMACHSAGGREWTLAEGIKKEEIYFFEDPHFSGGWYAFQEGDVTRLYCESATSGSSLTAQKKYCPQKGFIEGEWDLTLKVPMEGWNSWEQEYGDNPYKGAYWSSYHRATVKCRQDDLARALEALCGLMDKQYGPMLMHEVRKIVGEIVGSRGEEFSKHFLTLQEVIIEMTEGVIQGEDENSFFWVKFPEEGHIEFGWDQTDLFSNEIVWDIYNQVNVACTWNFEGDIKSFKEFLPQT